MSIKVYIQTEKFKGGPAVFRSRLISALNKFNDIKVTNNVNDKFDVGLEFIRKIHKYKQPYILRVDGCYYQKNRRSGNSALEKSILESRYLIFQSKFSLGLCMKILNINSKFSDSNYSIIHNGIDLEFVNKIKPDKGIISGSFVACARWRDNKRTFSILNGFLKANTDRHLYMVGGVGLGESDFYKQQMKKYKSKYIHILGKRKEKEIIEILKACNYLIHLCHIDSCPNIVVEGLSCGLNILCTNLGGTFELVKNDGYVLNVDSMWKGQYLSSSTKLDSLKKDVVAKGIHKMLKIKTKPNIVQFDINSVANKYADIIRKVYNGN